MESEPLVRPSNAWLGRVINALGAPVDGKGPLPDGNLSYALRAPPPPAHSRRRGAGKIDLAVRARQTFPSCCNEPHLAILAGSGVGQSVLHSLLLSYH